MLGGVTVVCLRFIKKSENDESTPSVANKRICLHNWSDMPQHLQFNPHIRSGYRPLTSFRGCVESLFYLHNETVNIVTHGFAILYILTTVPYLLPWDEKGAFYGFLSWCHLIGAVSPWIGSFLYHLFMSLNCGEAVYRRLLRLDMLGIWVCQSIGAMPFVSASIHCLPGALWHFCMALYIFLSLWGLSMASTSVCRLYGKKSLRTAAMRAKSPWERRLCFSPPFLMRMMLLALRYFGIGGGNPNALKHVVLQDLVAVVGGTIGALRIPEKWLSGQVDLALNSHNIMHVIVVLAVWSMHSATIQDMGWMSDPVACHAAILPLHEEL